jgi:hypothetical protein
MVEPPGQMSFPPPVRPHQGHFGTGGENLVLLFIIGLNQIY